MRDSREKATEPKLQRLHMLRPQSMRLVFKTNKDEAQEVNSPVTLALRGRGWSTHKTLSYGLENKLDNIQQNMAKRWECR